jgi:hypothetical protein
MFCKQIQRVKLIGLLFIVNKASSFMCFSIYKLNDKFAKVFILFWLPTNISSIPMCMNNVLRIEIMVVL